MEFVIVIVAVAWLGIWCYRKGKRVGSVKGYHAGRWRRRHALPKRNGLS